MNVDEGVYISDDCTHRSDVCSLFSIHVQVCELSSDDAFSFILYYGLKWDVDSTHSSCVLSIEKNLPDDTKGSTAGNREWSVWFVHERGG